MNYIPAVLPMYESIHHELLARNDTHLPNLFNLIKNCKNAECRRGIFIDSFLNYPMLLIGFDTS